MAHVFVVDDDDQLLRMVGLMLERGGHSATLISNPLEALELFREEVPDLAILDVMMPGMDGFELCQTLRNIEETKNLPIIILTARGPLQDEEHAFEVGADEYLTKPVTSQELLAHVDMLLKRKVQETEAEFAAESSVENSQPDPIIVSMLGLAGGSGKTTCVVNLAASLVNQHEKSVCLIDFTTSGGQAAMHLRIQPRTSWAKLDDFKNLDGEDIETQIVSHDSGIDLLPAPVLPLDPEKVSSDLLNWILTHLKTRYDFILFDLPTYLSPTVIDLIGTSDTILHVVNPDVISVQTAVRAERVLISHEGYMNKRHFVLNHLRSDSQLLKPTVERGLKSEIPLEIGYDPNQARALAQGFPLAMEEIESRLREGVHQIAALWATPVKA